MIFKIIWNYIKDEKKWLIYFKYLFLKYKLNKKKIIPIKILVFSKF
jgi:hypothetical protein